MKKLIPILCAGALSFSVIAQNNSAVNQATTVQQQQQTTKLLNELSQGDNVPPLYSEEDADVGPQSVLRKRKNTWFRMSADAQLFYTDNMNYREQDEARREAGVAVSTLEAALTSPSCITRFASYRGELGYRHQFFNYLGGNGRDDFNFDSSTAFADMIAQTKHYQFRAGFDYTRLLGFESLRMDDYCDFYTEYVPRWSVQRNIRVCDRSMVSLAYLGSYHFTDEKAPVIFSPSPIDPNLLDSLFPSDRSERWEHTFLAAYSVALPHHFVAQPYYRFQYSEFVNADDCLRLHTVGLGIGWIPCENFSVRGFVGYNWQDASNSNAEYEKLDAGGGINLTFRF
jgi:hypothetical protein